MWAGGRASPTPTKCSAASMFEMTFTTEPVPQPPQWITAPPMVWSSRECFLSTEASPPTRTVISPDRTRCTPPVRGASNKSIPRALASAPRRLTSCSSVVDKSIHVPRKCGKMCFSATSAMMGTDGREVSTTLHMVHRSSTLTHCSRPPPCLSIASNSDLGRASATHSSKPLSARQSATPVPAAPRPMRPTRESPSIFALYFTPGVSL